VQEAGRGPLVYQCHIISRDFEEGAESPVVFQILVSIMYHSAESLCLVMVVMSNRVQQW